MHAGSATARSSGPFSPRRRTRSRCSAAGTRRWREWPRSPTSTWAESGRWASVLNGVLEFQLHRGQGPGGARPLRAVRGARGSDEIQMQGGYLAAAAAIRLAEGDHEAALAASEQAIATREATGLRESGKPSSASFTRSRPPAPWAGTTRRISSSSWSTSFRRACGRHSSRRPHIASGRTSPGTIPARIATSPPQLLSFARSSFRSTSPSSSSSTVNGSRPAGGRTTRSRSSRRPATRSSASRLRRGWSGSTPSSRARRPKSASEACPAIQSVGSPRRASAGRTTSTRARRCCRSGCAGISWAGLTPGSSSWARRPVTAAHA